MTFNDYQYQAIIDRLDTALRRGVLPADRQLWTPGDVANYLGVSKRTVAERYAARPDFPQAIRLPSNSGKGLLRWKAGDVIRWADKQNK